MEAIEIICNDNEYTWSGDKDKYSLIDWIIDVIQTNKIDGTLIECNNDVKDLIFREYAKWRTFDDGGNRFDYYYGCCLAFDCIMLNSKLVRWLLSDSETITIKNRSLGETEKAFIMFGQMI